MRARAGGWTCALALCLAACGSGGPTPHGSQTTSTPPTSQTPSGQSADALATDAANAFLNKYMTSSGRVQRTDQGGDTVSEGQAYGMLLAAGIGDEHRFQRIWSWTRTHLQQSSGLFAFHWVDGRVVDHDPASDADLDTARALLIASCRFHRPDLREEAIRVGRAILTHETARAGSLEVLMAGPWANKGSYIVFDPSYVDPTTLNALATVTGDARFAALAAGGIKLIDQLTRPLPPDWAIVNTHTAQVTPVSDPNSTGGPGMYTYDAPRTLLWLAANPDPTGRSAAARAWSVFAKTRPQDIVTDHQLSGAAVGDTHSPITLVAAAAGAQAAGDTSAVPVLLEEAERLNASDPTYYGAAWIALGRLLLTTNRLATCSH